MKTLLQTLFFILLTTQICFAQWVRIGPDGCSFKNIAVQDSIIFGVVDYNEIGQLWRSVDNGTNWSVIVDSNAVDVAISPSGKVFMIRDSISTSYFLKISFLYSSLDNGNTWTRVNILEQLIDSIPGSYNRWPNDITIGSNGIIFCNIKWTPYSWEPNDAIARSTDDGTTWTTPGLSIQGGRIFDFKDQLILTAGIRYDPLSGNCWRIIYISTDNGNLWSQIGYPDGACDFNTLCIYSNNNIILGNYTNLGYESASASEVLYLTTNMFNTWTQIATLNSQCSLSFTDGVAEGILVGTDDLGIFLFSDEGDSLGSRNEGLGSLNYSILSLAFDNTGYAYLGVASTMMLGSGGLWRRPLSEIIPVELISFTATSNVNEVILNWSTVTEINNLGFEVERIQKSNIKIQNEWEKIGFVPGFGTTTEPKIYSYSDSKVLTGKYTYRLKQIDFDGSFEYSKEVEVEVYVPFKFLLEQNFPNPFNPSTKIKYSVPQTSQVQIKVFDLLGKEIETLVNEEKPAGTYEIEFNAANLPSGVYFYQLKADNYIETKKMILIK